MTAIAAPTSSVAPLTTTDHPAALDDWDNEPMPIRPVRRPFSPVTKILCALLASSAAFGAGVVVEKHHVPPATSAARTATARSGTPAASGASGTVTLIDGTNVYITESSGTVVKVATTPQSQITVTSPGTTANIMPGDTVTATGPTGSDGTVTATSLRDSGAGGGTGGRGAAGASTTARTTTTGGAAPAGG